MDCLEAGADIRNPIRALMGSRTRRGSASVGVKLHRLILQDMSRARLNGVLFVLLSYVAVNVLFSRSRLVSSHRIEGGIRSNTITHHSYPYISVTLNTVAHR
jgi:hypothetical protein